jgi:hypothetical protein
VRLSKLHQINLTILSEKVAPYFSIVVPTYNRASLIGFTLDSILAQKFSDFEVLIIDDGSKDNTVEVVKRYLLDSRMHYLPKENGERGIALLHPNHLSTLRIAIDAQMISPNFVATKYDFDRSGQRRPSDLALLPAGPLGFESFIQGNALACNICVRRENLGLKKFEEDRRYAAVEDWMFMLENTQHGEVVQLIDAVTLTMSDHDQRSMRADNQGLIRRLVLAADWMQKHLCLSVDQRRRLLGRVYYLCAIHAYADAKRSQALRFAHQAAAGLSAKTTALLLVRIVLGPHLVGLLKR